MTINISTALTLAGSVGIEDGISEPPAENIRVGGKKTNQSAGLPDNGS
jgi:hypothetical protein